MLKDPSLPQQPESAYDRRLSVMLYEYLRDIRSQVNGLVAKLVWTEAEIDFGATPVYTANFVITDTAVSAQSHVAVVASGNPGTGRVGNDWAVDGICFAALPASGSFTVTALASPGPVVGKRKILYQVG